eukprot:COSAG05_NODE_630_length_8210_cov_5.004563_1_plen_79_part_00
MPRNNNPITTVVHGVRQPASAPGGKGFSHLERLFGFLRNESGLVFNAGEQPRHHDIDVVDKLTRGEVQHLKPPAVTRR